MTLAVADGTTRQLPPHPRPAQVAALQSCCNAAGRRRMDGAADHAAVLVAPVPVRTAGRAGQAPRRLLLPTCHPPLPASPDRCLVGPSAPAPPPPRHATLQGCHPPVLLRLLHQSVCPRGCAALVLLADPTARRQCRLAVQPLPLQLPRHGWQAVIWRGGRGALTRRGCRSRLEFLRLEGSGDCLRRPKRRGCQLTQS